MTLKNEKKILVLGGEGLLGTSLAQFPWPKDYRLISLSHSDLDITDSNILNSCLSSIKPDYIINASVYGKGEGADAKKSYLTNTLALYSLSTYCKENNVLLVHYSTDYVFDGYQKTPYKECDKKNPLNIYGNSKYAGELIIESIAPPHFIIRSSWLFDVQGKNFVKWIYEQSKISQKLNIIDDQIGCPTYALDIVHATVHIINNYKNKNLIERNRTYHLTGKEPTSWYLYAKDILNIIKIYQDSQLEIIPISTLEYKNKFSNVIDRPLYSVLNCERIARECSIFQNSWMASLEKVVKNLIKD